MDQKNSLYKSQTEIRRSSAYVLLLFLTAVAATAAIDDDKNNNKEASPQDCTDCVNYFQRLLE
jgi:hypothetical protein